MKFSHSLVRIVPVLGVLFGILAIDSSSLHPRGHGQKPMFPVQSGLVVTGTPEPGGVADVVASLTAWIPGEDLAWHLELPAGVTLVEGPSSWTGQLTRGETKTLRIGVRIPDGAPHEITAVLMAAERPQVRSAATVVLDLGTPDGLKASRQVETGDGVSYIQYQGTVVPR